MTFATVCVNQEQLSLLSQLLITIFPGCTIHQNQDPIHAIRCLSKQKIDAMFADVDACTNVMDVLRKQDLNTQICFLCRQNVKIPGEITNLDEVLTYPITEQKMRTTLQRIYQNAGCRCDAAMIGDQND